MIRSLIAVVIAVLIGVTTAQLVERAALLSVGGDTASTLAYQFGLLASWGIAAFVAALVSLLIGRRWAPLGWLAASSMLLLAIVSALAAPSTWLLLPGAVIVTGAAGLGAIKLTKAQSTPPFSARKPDLFE